MGKIRGTFAGTYDKFVQRQSLLPMGLSKLVESLKAKDILEFACGTGAVAVGLAAMGYRVVGVDYSADMLKSARRKAREHDVDIRFVSADIGKVNLDRQFDLLLCLGNTIPHFTGPRSLARLFANCRQHLRPGGHIIIQQLNYDRILRERPLTFATDIDRDLIRIKQYRYRKDLVDFHITLVDSSQAPPRISSSRITLKPWLKDELSANLRGAGFDGIKTYSDYHQDRFTLKSKDLILLGNAR